MPRTLEAGRRFIQPLPLRVGKEVLLECCADEPEIDWL